MDAAREITAHNTQHARGEPITTTTSASTTDGESHKNTSPTSPARQSLRRRFEATRNAER